MANPFSNLEDKELMNLYQNGEALAFEVIYARYKNTVYSYLRKRMTEDYLIEETFQNIFIKFHKSRSLYNEKYPLLNWIFTISRSELLDCFKKHKIKYEELKSDIPVEDQNTSEEILNLENEKILTQKERDALKLRYFSEKDFLEISILLNTSETNSRKIISRAINKLRQKYQRINHEKS